MAARGETNGLFRGARNAGCVARVADAPPVGDAVIFILFYLFDKRQEDGGNPEIWFHSELDATVALPSSNMSFQRN